MNSDLSPASGRGGLPGWVKWAAALAALAGLFLLLRRVDLRPWLAWVEGFGPWAPAAFILLYGLSALLLIPGSLLTMAAGAVFGLGPGVVHVTLGSNLAANAAFLLGRFLLRERVEAAVERRPVFSAVSGAVAAEGWKMVLLLRLTPVLPFALLNYALGLTRVSWRQYAAASAVGMVPGTVVYVYVGHALGAAALQGEGRERGPAEWALLLLGLAATAVVAVVITRVARRHLEARLPRGGRERR